MYGYVSMVNSTPVEGAEAYMHESWDDTDADGYYSFYVTPGTYSFNVWPGPNYMEFVNDSYGGYWQELLSGYWVDSVEVTSDLELNVTLTEPIWIEMELEEEVAFLGDNMTVQFNVSSGGEEVWVDDPHGGHWELVGGTPVTNLGTELVSIWVHDWTDPDGGDWWDSPTENQYHDDVMNNDGFAWALNGSVDGIYEFNFTVLDQLPYNNSEADWLDLQVRVSNNDAWRGFRVFTGDVYTISGTVYNQSMHVVPYAEIDVISRMEWGTFVEADEWGDYSVLVPAGEYSMMFFGPDGTDYLPAFIDVLVDSDFVQDAVLGSLPDEFTRVFVSKEIDGNTTNLGEVELDAVYSLPYVIEVNPGTPLGDVEPMYIPEEGYRWKDIKEKWIPENNTLVIIFLYIEEYEEANNPPDAAYDPDPVNGADYVNITTELSWNANDPDEDPLTYDVYFGEAPNVTDGEPVATNISESWYSPPEDLDYNTTYYWVVDVYDWMNQTVGDLWNFTTEPMDVINTPPDAPYYPDPADGAEHVNVSTELSWTGNDPDEDPLTYELYFGNTSSPTFVTDGLTEETYNLGILNYSTTYYWIVVADDGMNWTESPVWNFTTEAEAAPEGWNVSIIVGVGIYSSMNTTFGMRDGATGSFDSLLGDLVLPPSANDGVESYFDYSSEPSTFRKLIVSYLSVDYPANWTYKVRMLGVASGLTTMSWNVTEVEAIPGDYTVTLVTPTGDVDMRSASLHTWTAEEEMPYTFTIIVEEVVP